MKIQFVTATVALGGDNNSTTHFPPEHPITYAETLVLAAIHGEGSVTDVAYVDGIEEERSAQEEFSRLQRQYGNIVSQVFPNVGGRPAVPASDDKLPSVEKVQRAREASARILGGNEQNEPTGKIKRQVKSNAALPPTASTDDDGEDTSSPPDLGEALIQDAGAV